MRAVTRARVLTFGTHREADLRASEVRSAWPDRLRFTLHANGTRIPVQTRLLGEHLVGSALAALGIAHALGIPLQGGDRAACRAAPVARRMSAHVTGAGVEVVRDDFKAASDSLDELLRFLAAARASRKILVVGRISDHPGRSRSVYTAFGRAAAAVADLLVFVGERPDALWGGDDRRRAAQLRDEFPGARARVAVFATVRDASRFLGGELRRGDLLVLKGSGASDHLERIVLERDASVQCWRAHCGLVVACDACAQLDRRAEPHDALPAAHPTL